MGRTEAMMKAPASPERGPKLPLYLSLVLLLISAHRLPAAGVPSFRIDIMPVFSKAGCNAGACHGNKNGKAGFKLSLRGEDPDWDLRALTRDQFARRTNPLEPDQSLILLKATAQAPHEGGQRFKKKSEAYDLLRGWIAAGMPVDGPGIPRLERIQVRPKEEILAEPALEVQINVRAFFSDGTEREVTKMAVYEPANSLAKVSPEGVVNSLGMGETTILVRYLNCQEAVRLAYISPRPDFKWENPPAENYIERHIYGKLRAWRMNPSPLCNDEVFLRRAYLDLLGIVPAEEESRAFAADPDSGKRARLVDRLLERPEFADFWALKWADLLRLEEKSLDRKGVQHFHRWIRQSLLEHKPLDQFARELIAARGSTYLHPPANFYRANRTPASRAEAVAQIFLGTRLQCAQCHNHPFDRWTQDDYYDWAAMFAQIQYKILENRRRDNNDGHEFIGEQIVWIASEGELTNPRTSQQAKARFLGLSGSDFKEGEDRLQALAQWLTENGSFARVQANRIWYHLMGRGLVDPIDDFRATNPASHPGLLEELSEDLKGHEFDLRHLIRRIMNSRTYQLSGKPNASNAGDEINYSHALPRRLTAEQMLDSLHQVAGVRSQFNGYPPGLRAGQLPGVEAVRLRDLAPSSSDQFLGLFGKPPRLLACECERSSEPSMGQAFELISGPAMNQLLTDPENRLGRLLRSGKSNERMIEELYWTALSRAPSGKELASAVDYLEQSNAPREALEDLTWALVNAKEFILRR